jgi:hypothetical protein
MTIFDFLRDLCFTKKSTTEITQEDLQQFQPFMINRWFTFYGKPQSIFINETLNKYSMLFDDKYDLYKFYRNIIPKVPSKMIHYVKKKQKDKAKEADEISLKIVSQNNNISTRELKMYVALSQSLIK